MRYYLLLIIVGILYNVSLSQAPEEKVIRKIFDNALLDSSAYQNLEYLCEQTPGRLLGTEASMKALIYFKHYFEKLGADTVFIQEFKTKAWKHIATSVEIVGSQKEKNIKLRAVALGPSPATPIKGIKAKVLEVMGLEELKQLDPEMVRGKIVFFNRPVDLTLINTFRGYGSAVDQRARGPALAARMGAAAALVRSVTTRFDTIPHSGSTRFDSLRLPCAAISNVDADILTRALQKNKMTQVKIKIEAEDMEEISSGNLVADLRGKEFSEEYIIVGGHIDAWYNTPGAHDDGAGCVQSADVMRIFKELGLKNKRTLRVVLFMDEELFQSGGDAYAKYSESLKLKTYFALEADAGAFTPDGFVVDAADSIISAVSGFRELLEPYGITYIKKGGSGVDIYPLKKQGAPLMGYRTDTQRYMDIHHSAADTFDKIHFRELQLGSGCMAAMVYLIDKNGY
jgi:hypothetical protein